MSVNFMESETKVNLMRAFAGESMARNRYVFSADFSKKEHFHVLEQLFRFTADQEQQHAKIFYNHLQELSGKTVVIDAGYPVDPVSYTHLCENILKVGFFHIVIIYTSTNNMVCFVKGTNFCRISSVLIFI